MDFACELIKNGMNADTAILLSRAKGDVGWLDRLFDSQTVKKMLHGTKFKDYKPIFLIKTIKTYLSFNSNLVSNSI